MDITTDEKIYGCKTYLFWLSDLVMTMVLLLFTYDAWEISVAIKKEIKSD